jgi:hypothetical protein
MIMLLKIVCLAFFACLSVFGQIISHNTGIDANDPQYGAKERSAFFSAELLKAKKVVDLTQDAEAKTLYSFLQTEAVIVAPIFYQGGVKILVCGKPSDKDYLFAFVVFTKDLAMDASFRARMTKEAVGAFYNPDTKTMILKEWSNFSGLWTGLLLLHEARHAYENIFSPYDWHDPQLFCRHERTTHEFENRLLAKIGGQAYAKILAREMARIEHTLDSGKVDWRQGLVNIAKIPGLDKVFGPSVSPYENDARCTHIWIDAYFHFFEKKCANQEEADAMKDHFLFIIYKDSKIL